MKEFTNEVIDLESLPTYETVPLQAPNSNYLKVILLNITVVALIIGAALIGLLSLDEEIQPAKYYVAIGYLILFLVIYILYIISFKKRGFALRDKDIIYKSGIIAETTSIVPFNRIQHVALNEGLFSRMYSLASIQVHTAGASSKLAISGLPLDQAKLIKEAILKKIEDPTSESHE